jgi:hypothetical protein
MDISLENLRRFVRDYGVVNVIDSTGKVRKLSDGEPDIWELIQIADRFHFAGAWYSRAEFENLMDTIMAKPGNVSQISLTEL